MRLEDSSLSLRPLRRDLLLDLEPRGESPSFGLLLGASALPLPASAAALSIASERFLPPSSDSDFAISSSTLKPVMKRMALPRTLLGVVGGGFLGGVIGVSVATAGASFFGLEGTSLSSLEGIDLGLDSLDLEGSFFILRLDETELLLLSSSDSEDSVSDDSYLIVRRGVWLERELR